MTPSRTADSLPAVAEYTDRLPQVEAANPDAARLALRVWVAVVAGAVLHQLFGGDSLLPGLIAIALTPLVGFAFAAATTVEVHEHGILRRGLIRSRFVRWEDAGAITFSRFGGIERYRVGGRLTGVTLTGGRPGFADAARRLNAIAAFRAIPIVAA